MKVFLVDGTFELFRSYYGTPSSTSPDKVEIGGTRGFLASLYSLLKQPDVTHIACAFDTVIESFRNKLFAGYKTGDGIEPELWRQFPLVEEAAEALGVTTWRMVDFEADDALASAADRFSKSRGVSQIVLATPDKDLFQCINGKKVVVWDRIRDTTYDDKAAMVKFGIAPASIPDYLALVGDAADGIPGIPRWGAKSSAMLLAVYHHIEKIPVDPEKWAVKVRGAAELSRNLNENRSQAALFKQLATLRTDVPLKEKLSDLKWGGVNRVKLAELGKKIGERNLPAIRETDFSEG